MAHAQDSQDKFKQFLASQVFIVDVETRAISYEAVYSQNTFFNPAETDWKSWLEFRKTVKTQLKVQEVQYSFIMGNVILLREEKGLVSRNIGDVDIWVSAKNISSDKVGVLNEMSNQVSVLVKENKPFYESRSMSNVDSNIQKRDFAVVKYNFVLTDNLVTFS